MKIGITVVFIFSNKLTSFCLVNLVNVLPLKYTHPYMK